MRSIEIFQRPLGQVISPRYRSIMATMHYGQCTVLKPPIRAKIHGPSVFLSGTVEMAAAIEWQRQLIAMLSRLDVTIINPRRDDWDSSWKQDISNPLFKDQVLWELDYMQRADVIALYLGPGTASPVSMLEFGLHARDGKVVVCCPEGYARRGNVQVVCERFELPLVDTIEELAELIEKRVEGDLNKPPSSN